MSNPLFSFKDVKHWVNDAAVINTSDLQESDVVNAWEAWHVYLSWLDGGANVNDIDRYWGNPMPLSEDLESLKRGFAILSQYDIDETSRSAVHIGTLPNTIISTIINAGHIAMSSATRCIGLSPREVRRTINNRTAQNRRYYKQHGETVSAKNNERQKAQRARLAGLEGRT